MKKRYWIGLSVALLCVIALAFYLHGAREVLLGERYPVLSQGSYRAAILWAGMDGNPIDTAVSDEEFRDILSSAKVVEGPKTEQAPDVEFLIHLFHGSTSYSIEVGADHSISVADMEDLAGTRTFWRCRDGQLFSKLYACHLNNGGGELPSKIASGFLKQ